MLPVQLLFIQTRGKGNCYQCNCSVNRQEGRVIVTSATALYTDRREGLLLPVQLLRTQTGGKGNCYQCNSSVNRQEGRVTVTNETALYTDRGEG